MIRNRIIGTIAALGGVTAAVALLSGVPTAKADELADLRANQQLLQERLDQLAQARVPGNMFGVGGPPGPTTVHMMGGSFPRSFLIPGTDTSIRVGGEIRENMLYWFDGGNPNPQPQGTNAGATGQAVTIPLNIHVPVAPAFGTQAYNRARSTSIFQQSPQQSKVNFETRTPTAWGEARTFLEFDFAGATGANATRISDSLIPRLRYAYATLGGFLAGQANSNFSDSDASAETLDFGGNVGDPGVVRIPQIRYTVPLAPWGVPGALSTSMETPNDNAWTPTLGNVSSDNSVTGNPVKSPAPVLTAAWYIPQTWGHMDFSTVLRPEIQIKDGAFVNRSFTGYGFNISGDVKPLWFGWTKDAIVWHMVWGNAIGTYLNSTNNFALVTNYGALPTTPAAAANVLVKPVTEYGGNIGYKHLWAPNLRSTISAGVNFLDANNLNGAVCPFASSQTGAGGCGSVNKEIVTAHANLIWNPVSFVDVGIEYAYGHRIAISNLKGDENVLISRFRVQF